MVALPSYNRTIQDAEGNFVPLASVEIRREVAGQPLVQLYSDREGLTAVGNPVLADANGLLAIFLAEGEYQVVATFGAETQTLRYERVGAPSIQNSFGPETEITGATYTVGALETFLTIKRTGPTLTTITLPAVANRAALPFAYTDWSSSIVTDHEIRFVADGSETVMKAATYSVWSNASGLARGWVYPAEDLSGWVVT